MSSTDIARSQNEAPPVQASQDGQGQEVRHWVVPPVDVLEKDGDLRLVFDVPGVSRDGLTVEVREGVLTISAQRVDQPELGYRRRFRLGDGVDVDRVSASVRHGVLTVELPQSEAARPRRITVQGS